MSGPLRRAAGAVVLGSLLLGGGTLAFADTETDSDSDANTEEWTISAYHMETVLVQGREQTVLTGSVELITERHIIRADSIKLFGANNEFVLCRGAVQVIDKEENIELASDELFFDRERSMLRIQGSVLLIDRDNEVVVKGSFLEYNQESGEVTVRIGVRILKPDDLVSRSEFARYRRTESTIELSGMPMVTWKGDEYQAMRIFIDLDQGTVQLDGAIRGTITVS